MTNLSEKDKSLASLALFSSLYDTHRNVRDVLIDFIKMSIMEHGELILRPIEVQGYLREDYGFDNVPIAVIEKSMCHAPYLEKSKSEKGSYKVKSINLVHDAQSYKEQVKSAKDEINQVLVSLREHLNLMKFPNADKIPEANLQRALSVFLIESTHNSDLSTLIHQFVILHPEYTSILQKINDGAIIFMGLSYTSKGSEYTTLQDPLTIYLDTEILFYGAGYNGPTYELLFKEFIDTVSKINNRHYERHGKRLILLRYFPQIKEEIDAYFAMAEIIIAGKAQLDPSRNAMSFLVKMAKTPSDLVRMKAKFWKVLDDNAILEEEYDQYYDDKNKDYNIESQDFVKELGVKEYSEEEEAQNNMAFLNFVNIRRGNKDQKKFSSIGYLFVTQTFQVYKLASIVQKNINPENFPLAISLSQITARLWLGLNQGFNPSATLRSMDVLVKAQIGLSAKINACLEKKHKDLQMEHFCSSPEEIATELAALRIYVPNSPEDLTMTTEVVKQVNNLDQFVDDVILEVQEKDEIIRTKENAYTELQLQYSADMKEKESEMAHLRGIVYANALHDFKENLAERKKQRKCFIRKANAHSFWGASQSIALVLLEAIISAILFMNDHPSAGYAVLLIGLIEIIIGVLKSFSDIKYKVQNLILPFSVKIRKGRVKEQLKDFSKVRPYPSLQEFIDSYMKLNKCKR